MDPNTAPSWYPPFLRPQIVPGEASGPARPPGHQNPPAILVAVRLRSRHQCKPFHLPRETPT